MAENGGEDGREASVNSGRGGEPGSKMPKYSTFTQQEMWACRPILTPAWAIAIFLVLALIFIPIGAASLAATQSVVEVSHRYDSECVPGEDRVAKQAELLRHFDTVQTNADPSDDKSGISCTVTFTIPKTMEAPVFLYYEIDGMLQNHRRYVSSRSDPQLRGSSSTATLSDCKPQLDLDDEDVSGETRIRPCGLIAWSLFNDTYTVHRGGTASDTNRIGAREMGIAWSSDIKRRFSDLPTQNLNTIPDKRGGAAMGDPRYDSPQPMEENEHLIVWMRTATLPRFRKLWAIIDEDLEEGEEITVEIQNRYNTYRFDGKKSVVLSTASWMGGANDTVGIIALVVGCTCLLCAVGFFALVNLMPRRTGDLAFLSWNQP